MEMNAYYDSANHIVVVDSDKEGEVTTEYMKLAARLAMKIAGEHNCNDLLFDITAMREVQSLEEGISAMKNVSKTTGLTFEYKCAVVYNPELYSEKRAGMIQSVANHRPNPPFKMFVTKEEAIKWLKTIPELT